MMKLASVGESSKRQAAFPAGFFPFFTRSVCCFPLFFPLVT
jgi:hypothetical protein